MKWNKLGKIFDPRDHQLANNCKEFAQSPQALVLDDCVRIYFSTREIDPKNGKYLSHISFVDFDKNLTKILNVSNEPVIELGELGSFDEHGIFPINPFKDGDHICAYTCGWSRRTSVSVETSIGFAFSKDNGTTFKRKGPGPILTASVNEPMLVGDGFVAKFNGVYYMWYIYGNKWFESPDKEISRVYKIGYAVSENGISWNKEGKQLIQDRLDENECQALPSVVKYNGLYHMVFCYRYATDFRTNAERSYKLGYAYSKDLVNWKRDDNKVEIPTSMGSWDSEMMCYPHLFHCNDQVYLLYNGNQFGRFGFGLAVAEK